MKVLIVSGHPDLDRSRANKELLRQVDKSYATVHNLSEHHSGYEFNIQAEQDLLIKHDRIVLLFPLYWYSMPALMKKWLDDVFLPGFAYARGGDKLAGKEFLVATTVGAPREGYRAGGFNNFTLDELLRPLQQTANYVKATFLPPIALYESVFLSDAEISARVSACLPDILELQDSPDVIYERLLLKAEATQIDLISA